MGYYVCGTGVIYKEDMTLENFNKIKESLKESSISLVDPDQEIPDDELDIMVDGSWDEKETEIALLKIESLINDGNLYVKDDFGEQWGYEMKDGHWHFITSEVIYKDTGRLDKMLLT